MKEDVVGKIHFLGLNGEIGETVEYTDTESYLNSIDKEINQNPDGFRYVTITNLPEIRKAVDDIIYSAHGLDNPHEIDWYCKPKEEKGG